MPLMRLTRRAAPDELVSILSPDLQARGVRVTLDASQLRDAAPSGASAPAGDDTGGDGVAPPATTSVGWLIGSYLSIAAFALVAIGLWAWRNPPGFTPGAG